MSLPCIATLVPAFPYTSLDYADTCLCLAGGTVLAGALGVVALATVLVLNQGSGETLNQIQTSDIESLTTIAARIAKSI